MITTPLKNEAKLSTLSGQVSAKDIVTMRDFCLPEFDKNRKIQHQKALVFNEKCRCGIILCTYLPSKSGIKINYETGFLEWFGCCLPLRDPNRLTSK